MASIDYRGFKFVEFPIDQTRNVKFMIRDGNYNFAAIMNKGNIAVSLKLDRTNLTSKLKEKLSYFLYRLKLISRDDWEADHRKYELEQFDMSLASLEHDAEVLGYRVVKMRSPKKVKL